MNLADHRTKPRLLYVENFLHSFQSSRLCVALEAARLGFEVHAAIPFTGASAASLHPDIEWHDLPIGRDLSPAGEARTLASLMALYRRLRPDLVHHIRPKAIVYGGLAARSLGIHAVINTLTGLGHVFHTDSIRARLLRTPVTQGLRLACGHANQRLVVQNSEDFQICVQAGICPANRLVLIKGSGVDLRRYRPLPEPQGTVLVILPGRMLWDKGVREFVAAAEQLRSSGLPVKFALVGRVDPESPAALTADDLRAWEESGAVEWWGWRDDMRQVIAQSHIVCLPSYGEGAPRALMEAAACARAIVTTDVAGCRDVVIDGWNGLVVPPRDTQALAAALHRLITQPELRSRLAQNGPPMMEEHFSLRTVIARNLALYREVLGCVPTPPGVRRIQEDAERAGENEHIELSTQFA
jgi:glycosyltransferase involved in cell wall biosynthesis